MSSSTDFRSAKDEIFLCDTGATVSIIGLQVAKDNGLKVNRLKTPRKIIEISGGTLDIVGQCEFFVKLEVLGRTKRLTCLVLRGNKVDREILISGQMLKIWDMIHPSFPNETISTYVRKLRSVKLDNKVSSMYDKSPIPTSERISTDHKGCIKLWHKTLKKYLDVFKDRLDKQDRVKIKPVHLEIDTFHNIRTVHTNKPYD